MAYLRCMPPTHLRGIVDHFWVFEDHEVPASSGLLFADGCTDLMINLTEPLTVRDRDGRGSRWGGAWVSGHRTRPVRIELSSRRFTMVGARLHATGLASVLKAPASEVADQVVELREFWCDERESTERVANCHTPEERLVTFAAQIARSLDGKRRAPEGLAQQVSNMHLKPMDFNIDELRAELGISHKHLTRLFRKHVGLTPKTFQRVSRFRRLLRLLALTKDPDWSLLALECGYFDQPHLCRDFQSFTGRSPTKCPVHDSTGPDYLPIDDRGLEG